MEEIKNIFREFLKNEVEEIRQNKFRVVGLIFFTLATAFFMLFDYEEEQINLNEPVQFANIEKQKNVSDDRPVSDKGIIHSTKNKSEPQKNNLVVVMGANSDDLYVRDPFAVDEKVEVIEKTDNTEVENITAMTLKNSAVSSDTSVKLPPIPHFEWNVSEQQRPIIPESSPPTEEYILVGTAISGNHKNAIIKKVAPSQGKDYIEEDIIVGLGDYVQGSKIIDITETSLVFDDNRTQLHMSGFNNLSLNSNRNDTVFSRNVEYSQIDLEYEKKFDNPENEELVIQNADDYIDVTVKSTEKSIKPILPDREIIKQPFYQNNHIAEEEENLDLADAVNIESDFYVENKMPETLNTDDNFVNLTGNDDFRLKSDVNISFDTAKYEFDENYSDFSK
ncbi:MAG: hypothetical protein IK062_03805 [Selenomonadaceae bacterium]|nr:hypothetical protein [Selenomonadaceae bacterium]